MKTFTKEEFKNKFKELILEDYFHWCYYPEFDSFRDTCDCLSMFNDIKDVRVYIECPNCCGKGFPPIPMKELR